MAAARDVLRISSQQLNVGLCEQRHNTRSSSAGGANHNCASHGHTAQSLQAQVAAASSHKECCAFRKDPGIQSPPGRDTGHQGQECHIIIVPFNAGRKGLPSGACNLRSAKGSPSTPGAGRACLWCPAILGLLDAPTIPWFPW